MPGSPHLANWTGPETLLECRTAYAGYARAKTGRLRSVLRCGIAIAARWRLAGSLLANLIGRPSGGGIAKVIVASAVTRR